MIDKSTILAGCLLAFITFGGIGSCAAFYPKYHVYSAEMAGEAELAQATQNRKIIIQQAQAEKEAEVLRAEGTAQANKIIGDSLRENADYLRWMWLNKLDAQNNKTVIYVPTDGMIPSLETGRVGSAAK